MPRALECRPRSLALAPELAWLLSLQWLWEETSGLPARTYQQVDRSFSKAFQSTSWTSCPHKFQARWSVPGQWPLLMTRKNTHCTLPRLPTRPSTCHVIGTPCDGEDDAEVGDFQTKIFYTLIRSGLASLWTLLLGNIFRFRAIIYVMGDRNGWKTLSAASLPSVTHTVLIIAIVW